MTFQLTVFGHVNDGKPRAATSRKDALDKAVSLLAKLPSVVRQKYPENQDFHIYAGKVAVLDNDDLKLARDFLEGKTNRVSLDPGQRCPVFTNRVVIEPLLCPGDADY